jgi:hypothetical protein
MEVGRLKPRDRHEEQSSGMMPRSAKDLEEEGSRPSGPSGWGSEGDGEREPDPDPDAEGAGGGDWEPEAERDEPASEDMAAMGKRYWR